MTTRIRITFCVVLLILAAQVSVISVQSQSENDPAAHSPLTKEDLLLMIKATSGRKMSDQKIADELDRRGIGFKLDDAILQEFKNAGARAFLLAAIKRVASQTVDAGPKLARPGSDQAQPENAELSEDEAKRELEARLSRLPVIEQARYYALDFTHELPNFVVTQVVKRFMESPGSLGWRLQDTLQIEVTYRSDKGEAMRLVSIDGRPTTETYDDLDGSTSVGEFGSLLADLFTPQSRAVFTEVKHDQANGSDSVVYDFTVLRANSSSRITEKNSKQTVIAGYTGSIWVDTATKRVLRIEQSATEIPFEFPISTAEDSVDYDWVDVAGEKYLLPVDAEVLLGRDRDHSYSKNVIEFRNYHKFEGDVKILPDSSGGY